MATKGGREKIKLESTAGTGHFYTCLLYTSRCV